jgi:hypothetical protein
MVWGIVMVGKATAALAAGLVGLALAGCDTFDDSGPSPEVRAYNACQPTYMDKHRSLATRWAFISGVDDDGGTGCYSGHGYSSSMDAVRATVAACEKEYAHCWIFATSDGLSDWVKQISANLAAGRDPDWRPGNTTASNDDDGGSDSADNSDGDGGSSLGDFLGGLTDFLNGVTGVVQATQGGGGSSGGGSASIPRGNGSSQKGAFDDCAKLFDALGPAGAAQKAECEQRSRNMGTAR